MLSVRMGRRRCIREEKETWTCVKKKPFWLDLDETVEKIPKNERIVVGADLKGHVEEGNSGDEECMGGRNFYTPGVITYMVDIIAYTLCRECIFS